MTWTKSELKGLVKKAAKAKQDNSNLSIPAAMRVAKLAHEEADDRMLQM
jgi:hypothetical protein